MAAIALLGGPRGLILAEKSRIASGGQPAIAAAHLKFPPCTGRTKDGFRKRQTIRLLLAQLFP